MTQPTRIENGEPQPAMTRSRRVALADPPGGLANEQAKRRGLRKMKLVALGFLAVATIVFLLTSWAQASGWTGWVGYLRAAAEAGMVGALADWFAITALFRHPIGIKIPHTAIIPSKKDMLGNSLGEFVGTNFLSEAVIRDKVQRIDLSRRLGEWLAQPTNADRVTAEAATVLRGAITVLRDEDVQAVLEQAIRRRVLDQQWGPPLGRLLGQVFADGAHHKLVDLLCARGYEWVRDHRETVERVVAERAPSWSPKFVDHLLADKVYAQLAAFALAVKTDPQHPVRLGLDTFLANFANDLQHDPATMARAEQVKDQVLSHAEVKRLIDSVWASTKAMLLIAADDPASELRSRLRAGLGELGARLASDDSLRSKVDAWVEDAAAYVVNNYSREIATIISDTVQRWDAQETSRKIELQIGRDLQFIRINGTVVGALAGLLIYTIAQWLF